MKHAVLVTGGAGYIGAQTCKALAAEGILPVTFDNLSLGHKDFVRWGPFVHADIRDANAVETACRDFNVVAAVHFAAFAAVAESVAEPLKYYDTNVAGTISLLEGIRRAGVERIVFSSSCAVYGMPARQPITEQTLANPINPYGMSKLIVERILSDCAAAYGLQYCALRYFNAAGADLNQELGELRENETHLIPRAMMWLQGRLGKFEVFGIDYPTCDGTAIRDYIHVCDLADAHVLALKRILNRPLSGFFNLGTGRGYSVREVLSEIENATGALFPKMTGDRRPGDPPILIADPTHAREVLGFSPRYSDLKTIVQTAWAWHRQTHPRIGIAKS